MTYQRSLHMAGKYLFTMLLAAMVTLAHSDELSLTKLADDPNLVWGPCPAFMGKQCKIAVLHGDPAKDNSDILFKVPGSFKIPLHWHTSPERMVLLKGKMSVTYEGEKTNTLHTNSYAYGPAKKPHRAYCHNGEDCVLFIAFEKPIDAYEIKETIACLEDGI